jgi:hypothetical protein
VIRVDTVDAFGQENITALSPWRDVYLWGASGTRTIYAPPDSRFITGSDTMSNTDGRVFGDATAASFTFNLLSGITILNQECFIQKIDASANTITVQAFGSDVLSAGGSSSVVLANQYDGVLLKF